MNHEAKRPVVISHLVVGSYIDLHTHRTWDLPSAHTFVSLSDVEAGFGTGEMSV